MATVITSVMSTIKRRITAISRQRSAIRRKPTTF
jgi:hypothetical protein